MKTIYYAYVQKLEVPDSATEEEIDDIVSSQFKQPIDYMWSEIPDLFNFEDI
jgi:hypothetical protein